MQYQMDVKISAIKFIYISIYLPSIDIYVLIFTCRKWQCRIVSSLLEPEVPNMRVLKFCLPKKSIIEQLDSGYIDTLIQDKGRKITK